MAARPEPLLLELSGLRCAGCADTIASALRAVAGVTAVEVHYAAGLARIDGSGLELAKLIAAVEAAGYHAAASGATAQRLAERSERHLALAASALALLSLLLPGHESHLAEHQPRALGPWLQALLALAALAWPGRSFLRGAWTALRSRRGTMDLLVALGAGAATVLAVLAAAQLVPPALDHGHAAVWLVAFLRIGKWLEARVRSHATSRMHELLELLPATARRRGGDGRIEEVAAADLVPGEQVVVAPGERLPADGIVREGQSSVDAASLRGEPLPIDVAPGSRVAGGCVNLQAPLLIEVTAAGAASQVGQIGRLVRDALSTRAPIVTLAERAAAWFVPAVIGLALLTALGHAWLGSDVVTVVGRALATVVISCPCALALATPTALVAAMNGALRRGLLVKETALFERLAAVGAVLFDKTGTLTEGRLVAGAPLHSTMSDAERATLRQLAANSRHAAAQAVAAQLSDGGPPAASAPPEATATNLLGIEERAGLGVRMRQAGKEWRLGRASFALQGEDAPPADLAQGAGVVVASVDGRRLAAWPLLDRVRPGAAAAIAALQARGLHVAMVTGDRRSAALEVARALGLTEAQVHADCTPTDKAARVTAEQQRHGPLLFVGDGFNDAAALAIAAVGAAMGGAQATDLARAAGGLVLLRDDPLDVVAAIDLARATRRVLRGNVVLAVAYNVVALPWAMGLLAQFGVTAPEPAAAGLAMAASSLAVVLNALRLARPATLRQLPRD